MSAGAGLEAITNKGRVRTYHYEWGSFSVLQPDSSGPAGPAEPERSAPLVRSRPASQPARGQSINSVPARPGG